MTFHPLVSIVIPVYNGANYLREAIESALTQSYPNIEVIVINDGSRDDGATAEIARAYGERIVYREKPNGGVATALNLGIETMRGDYFSWLSHDDVYLPHKVARQVDFLARLENKQVVLYSDYELIDEKSVVTTEVHLAHKMLSEKMLYSVLRGAIHGCSTLVPRSALVEAGGFDAELATTQDYALWFRLAREMPFLHLPEVLIQSRWHDAQGSKIHPATLREANQLWIGFCDNVSDAEILSLEPSRYSFFQAMADFLSATPYELAHQHAVRLAQDEKQVVVESLDTVKVSVVVPVFNRIPWAVEALQSVLNQTHKNLEILLVNNGSSEDLSPLRYLTEAHQNVILLESDLKGASKARNLGLEKATGEFVAFLDADDLWLPQKISSQLEEMLLTGALASYTDYETFGSSQDSRVVHCPMVGEPYASLVGECSIATPTVLLKTEFLRRFPHLRFREDLTVGEDTCLWLDIAKKTTFLHLSHPWTRVRLHGNNAAYDSSRQVEGLLKIIAHLATESGHYAPKEAPLELCGLLRNVYWELEAIGAQDLLERATKGVLPWPHAPLLSRFACLLGRCHLVTPEPLKPLSRKVSFRFLLCCHRLAKYEYLHKDQLRRFARLLGYRGS